MQTITLSIDGMSCGHCVASVRRALGAVAGLEVRDVRIGSAELAAPDAGAGAAAVAAVRDAGYEAAIAPAAAALPRAAAAAGACCAPGATLTPLTSSRTR